MQRTLIHKRIQQKAFSLTIQFFIKKRLFINNNYLSKEKNNKIKSKNQQISDSLSIKLLSIFLIFLLLKSQTAQMSYGYTRYNSYSYGSQEIKCKIESDNPIDTVQYLTWDPFRVNEKGFLAASWDGYVRYYQITGETSEQIAKKWEYFLEHPVICCDINSDMVVIAGLGGGEVVGINMRNGGGGILGSHDAPICAVFWVERLKVVISMGFDNHIKIWTLLPQNNGSHLKYDCQIQAKIHAAAFDYPYILLGSAKGQVAVIDINNINSTHYFESIKNFEIYSKFICARIHSQSKKFCLGTADGRTVMGEFTTYQGNKVQNTSVSKSQKKQQYRSTLIGHCNTVEIGYHNNTNYYIMAGLMDLGIYNINKKEKTKTIKNTPSMPITACRISPKGDYLLYAYGNDWSQGLNELTSIKKPKILATKLTSSDLNSFVSK